MPRSHDVEGTGQHLVGQIMYFFCKCIFSLTIGQSNFKLYRCIGHIILKVHVLSNILCDLDPKVKVIGQKAGICDGVPSTSALVLN